VSLPAERSVIVDEEVVAVSVPLPALRYALRGLAVQPTLSFPARFLLTPEHGPALRAEIPRLLPLRECKELAHQALDEAVLEAARPRALSNGPVRAPALSRETAERASQALEDAGVACERGDGGLEIRGGAGLPGAGRITVESCAAGDGVRTAAETTLRLNDPSCLHAMARYALELNHRLRLACAAVDGTGFQVGRVHWQAVLPASVPLERGLCRAVEAVAVARSLSSQVFAALAEPTVAAAYLDLRFPHESPEAFIPAAAPPAAPTAPAAGRTAHHA
jgi:hypothetical protein